MEVLQGSTFEALNFVGAKNLQNMLIILDHNKIASCSFTEELPILELLNHIVNQIIFVDHKGHSYEIFVIM